MKPMIDWLTKNHDSLVNDLSRLVAIPSISPGRKHAKEIDQTADLTCEQMRQAGLENVEILRTGESYPYAYGEWLGASGKPTVFLYAHHDVQPVDPKDVDAGKWHSPPWELTRRDGRLYGRGSADDKGAITAQLGAVASFLKTKGELPVNVKMLVEGEEEVGSSNLMGFFREQKDRIQADVIVVCDTENIEVGLPCITYALRGIVAVEVEVKSAEKAIHSGMGGGAIADAAIALNVILSRLYWKNGKLPIPGFYKQVRPMTSAQKRTYRSLPHRESEMRKNYGIPKKVKLASEKGASVYEQTWRKPAVTIVAQEASSFEHVSNQVLPKASALLSCRIVPDMDPRKVLKQLQEFLTKDPPWGVQVSVKAHGHQVKWWMTEPEGPAFSAAMAAMKSGFKKEPVAIGCGGTIGFVGPLADLLDDAPALLLGIEDPKSAAHSPDESLHEGDWKKLMASLAHLFQNLGDLPDGKVK